MRPGHLRPGTAKLAAKAAAKLSTRLSPGEKHGRKRMAELVAVYDLDPEPRTVDDLIPASSTSRVGKQVRRPGPVVTGKWLAASVTDDIPAVITRMFDEAERRDPNHERTWVALVDGNRQQIDTIRDQAATPGHHRDHHHRLRPRDRVRVEGRLDLLLPRRSRRRDLGRRPRPDHPDRPGSRRGGHDPPPGRRCQVPRQRTHRCRRSHHLPDRQGPVPGLRHRPGQRLADRHRDHRRRSTIPHQGQDGHHRREVDHPWRRSRPAPARRHRQRRLRRVLAMAPTASTPPHPPRPLPTTRSRSLARVLDASVPSAPMGPTPLGPPKPPVGPPGPAKSHEYDLEAQHLANKSSLIRELWEDLDRPALALGSIFIRRGGKSSDGYFRGKRSFCTIEIQKGRLLVYLPLSTESAQPWNHQVMRDVSKIGHFGMGGVEYSLVTVDQLDEVRKLIVLAYGQH